MLKENQSITLEKDSYTLIKRISEGEQGVIWQVTVASTGQLCILKTVRTGDAIASRRMQEEIDFLRAVQTNEEHCFIASCLDHGMIHYEELDLPAMIMPYYPKNLEQQVPRRINQHPTYDFPLLLSWLTQLSQALQCTHEQMVDGRAYMHGDMNPANILLTENNEVRLIDFGIAKQQSDEIGTTSIAHSSIWSAPEQVLPESVQDNGDNIFRLTEKTDLYSLGLIAYYLYTGGEKPKAQTEFIDRQRNQAIYNRHVMSLKSGKNGQLGKVGGLSKKDRTYLHRRLFTLFFTQNKKTKRPMQPKDSLPLPHVMCKEILSLINQLLLPQAAERPSAALVKQKFQRLQRYFSPRLDTFTATANKNDLRIDETLELKLQLNGEGLTAPFDWLQIYDQNQQLLSFNVLSVAPDNAVFLAKINSVRLRVAAFEIAGDYQLSIIAAVGDEIHTVEVDCHVQASASQLWERGQHEAALKKDLRTEWLNALQKKTVGSAKARTDYVQLLKKLQKSVTDDKQKSHLETLYRDATTVKKPFWQKKSFAIIAGLGLLGGILLTVISNIPNTPQPETAATLSASNNNAESEPTTSDIVLTPADEEEDIASVSESSVEVTQQQEAEATSANDGSEDVTVQQETDPTVTSEKGESDEEVAQQATDSTATSEEVTTAIQQEVNSIATSEDDTEVTTVATQQEDDSTASSENGEEVAAQPEIASTTTSESSEEAQQKTNPDPVNERRTRPPKREKEVTAVNESSTKVTQQENETTSGNTNDKGFSQKEVNAIESLLN